MSRSILVPVFTLAVAVLTGPRAVARHAGDDPAPTTPPPAGTAGPAPTAAPVPAPATPSGVAREAGKKLDAYRTADARAELSPVAGQASTNAEVAIALGRILEQEKKYEESAQVLRKAAEAAPAEPRVPLYLGETLLRARKTAEAEAAFRKAAELATRAAGERPDDAAAFRAKGAALSRLRRFDEAMEALGKARTLDGGSAETLYQMGSTRAFQQKWSEAADLLSQAIGKEPGLAFAYYYRGLVQEKLGRKDLMVLDLDRFVKIAPSAPEAERARSLLAAATR